MNRFIAGLCICWLSLVGAPQSLQALEFEAGDDGICVATLRGSIVEGDAEALSHMMLDAPVEPADPLLLEDGRWRSICLDSPGGLVDAALNLGLFLQERRIGTVVNDGAECIGACALAFMYGSATKLDGSAATLRRLHVGGKLGFQRPEILLNPDREYSEGALQEANNVALDQLIRFQAEAGQPRPDGTRSLIDADLVGTVLQYSGGETFAIDTVNKAGRWDISLFGFGAPVLDERGLVNACQNMTVWPTRLVENPLEYKPDNDRYSLTRSSFPSDRVLGDRFSLEIKGEQPHACFAALVSYPDDTVRPALCGHNAADRIRIGPHDCDDPEEIDRWIRIPDHAVFPADTTLTALQSGEAMPAPQKRGADVPNLCEAESGTARVANVENFTSLRETTSHDSERIAELPLGSEFSVPRQPTVVATHPQHDDCLQLCRAAQEGHTYDVATVRSCIRSDWMWFEATGPNGGTGFVSAEFLEY